MSGGAPIVSRGEILDQAIDEAIWRGGTPCWARMGSYGWRLAWILFPGGIKTYVPLQFDNGSHGSRLPEDLRPRDPKLNGKDKPSPADAAALARRFKR